jgi:protein SCO1/2
MPKFKPETKKWLFLTGDTTSIYNLARKGFLVNAVKESEGRFYL